MQLIFKQELATNDNFKVILLPIDSVKGKAVLRVYR